MHSYFVVMENFGSRGLAAQVDPDVSRVETITRIVTGQYRDIEYIHHVHDGRVEDVTEELTEAAQQEMFARGMEVA